MEYSFEERLSYYGIGSERQESIKEHSKMLTAAIPHIIDAFYEHVTSNKVSKDLFQGYSLTALREKQSEHWISLVSGGFDEGFLKRSEEIGIVHERVGINPLLYVGGYSYVLARFSDFIADNVRDKKKCKALMRGVSSLLMMDMEVALTSYNKASNATEANNFADKLLNQNVELSIATNNVSIGNARMMTSLTKTNSQVQTIAAAVEEMSAGVATISANSEQVVQGAETVMAEAQQGKEIIQQTSQNMNNVSEAVTEASGILQNLVKTSDEISGMVGSIEKIASQTNLLALNATIEAARAGEAGKGFAVVAGEVKNLATQTAKATENITNLIEALVSELERVVTSMNDGVQAVSRGEETMHSAVASIDNIFNSASQNSGRMAEISGVLAEQEQAANEVSSGVSLISESSMQNVDSINESLDATEMAVGLMGEQVTVLAEYDIPNKSIRIAKSDHVIWVKKLADMMLGRATLNPDELSSHLNCRLGKWYYGPEAEKIKNHPVYQELEAPHKIVHECGIEAARRHNDNDHEGALEMVEKVEDASKIVVGLLDKLITDLSK